MVLQKNRQPSENSILHMLMYVCISQEHTTSFGVGLYVTSIVDEFIKGQHISFGSARLVLGPNLYLEGHRSLKQ